MAADRDEAGYEQQQQSEPNIFNTEHGDPGPIGFNKL
jgi:hypothetical protein